MSFTFFLIVIYIYMNEHEELYTDVNYPVFIAINNENI